MLHILLYVIFCNILNLGNGDGGTVWQLTHKIGNFIINKSFIYQLYEKL